MVEDDDVREFGVCVSLCRAARLGGEGYVIERYETSEGGMDWWGAIGRRGL